MNKCCIKWLSNDIVRIAGTDMGSITHLFAYCPECGKKLTTITDMMAERINKLRHCDWLSSELFFKIRAFLLED